MESQNIRSKMIYRLESRRVSNFIDFQANFKNFKNIRNHWTNLTFMTFSEKFFYNTSNSMK